MNRMNKKSIPSLKEINEPDIKYYKEKYLKQTKEVFKALNKLEATVWVNEDRSIE